MDTAKEKEEQERPGEEERANDRKSKAVLGQESGDVLRRGFTSQLGAGDDDEGLHYQADDETHGGEEACQPTHSRDIGFPHPHPTRGAHSADSHQRARVNTRTSRDTQKSSTVCWLLKCPILENALYLWS